jgi:Arc/MetJ family transcription regulator
MRATLNLDDDLVAKAAALSGLTDTTALIRAALAALIERERARALIQLGGTQPGLRAPRRRRSAG